MDIRILPRADLEALVTTLSQSHLGILSGPAIRYALARLSGPIDLIAVDWRKLHEWNDILGYDVSNVYLAAFAQTRHGTDRRQRLRVKHARRPARLDLRGVWGGDELLFAVSAGDGIGLLMRLIGALDTLSARLTAAERAAITDRTGGLIAGFAVAAVLIAASTDPLTDAARAVAECGRIKAGAQTGTRATSGKAGTIIGTLES